MGADPVRWTQYTAGIISSFGAFAFGAAFGWSSSASFMLLEENEILKLDISQIDWVASIINIGCIISSLFIGILLDKLGRKGAMLVLVAPLTIGWLLIIFGHNYSAMLFGRVLLGVGGGLFLSCPQYSTEIADKKIRGTLGTFVQLQFTGGILFAYVVGSFCNIFLLSVICGILPTIFGILFSFMPETPYYLLSQNREIEAIDALIWLRGPNYDCTKEVEEIKIQIKSLETDKSSVIQAFQRRSTKRALIITIGLVFFLQTSGINVILFYMKEIFEVAGVGLSSDVSSIIMGIVQVLATGCASVVIDRSGRKILLLISSFVMAICLTMLGSFYYLKDIESDYIDQLGWLPLTSLSFYVLAFSIGLGPVPWLIVSEVYSHDVKAIAGSLTCTVGWIVSFIITSNFNKFPMGPIFWIFAAITAFGVLFEMIFVPETKGKSLAEIQHILSKK